MVETISIIEIKVWTLSTQIKSNRSCRIENAQFWILKTILVSRASTMTKAQPTEAKKDSNKITTPPGEETTTPDQRERLFSLQQTNIIIAYFSSFMTQFIM